MGLRKTLASLALLGLAAIHIRGVAMGWGQAISVLYAGGMIAGAVALLRDCFWARLYVLGVLIWNLMGLVTLWGAMGTDLGEALDGGCLWVSLLPYLPVALLAGRRAARHYEGQRLWGVGPWRSLVLSWSVILNVAMVHGLVQYLVSWGDWIGAGLRALTAATLAGAVAARGLLLDPPPPRRRLFGLCGGAATVLAIAAAVGLHQLILSGVHPFCGDGYAQHFGLIFDTAVVLAGLVSGALAALAAVAAFGRPMVRYLRRS